MIEFYLNKEDGIVYANTTGDITLEQMLDVQDKIMTIRDLPGKLRILEDATNAVVKFSMSDVKKIRDLIEKKSPNHVYVKHAVVLNSPIGTAFGMWFDDHCGHINYKLKVFHSISAAKQWVLL